jgi:hypothetical protein
LIAATWSSPEAVQRPPETVLADAFRSSLVGAFAAPHGLPDWLKWGITRITYEEAWGPGSHPKDLRSFFAWAGPLDRPAPLRVDVRSADRLPPEHKDRLVAPGELGYWTTRYVEEQRPGLLRSLLEAGCDGGQIEERLGRELGPGAGDFRTALLRRTADHFAGP